MPFRNSVVAAVISTALAGSRIVIDGTGALANYIRFYTGKATESAPATITGQSFGPADPSYPNALYLGLEGARHTDDPLRNPATLRLITTPGPNMAMQADADYITLQATTQASMRSAGVAEIDADIITLGKYSIPLTDPPALRLGAFSTLNVLGPWVPYTPALTASTTNPTIGAGSVWRAAYMVVGKTCHVRWRFIAGTGWSPGSGTIAVGLPLAAKALTEGGINGPGFIVNPLAGPAEYVVNWTGNIGNTSVVGQFANAPGTYVNSGALNGTAAQISGSITYEIA